MSEIATNSRVGRPEPGQWYVRTDNGGMFQVVGRDEESRAIEIQSYDGDLDEIDAEVWSTLPLERNEPPEDWTASMDAIDPSDVAESGTGAPPTDATQPLRVLKIEGGTWEDTMPEEERGPVGEGVPSSTAGPRFRGRAGV